MSQATHMTKHGSCWWVGCGVLLGHIISPTARSCCAAAAAVLVVRDKMPTGQSMAAAGGWAAQSC
jgi:hypothetical protein